MNNSRCAHGKPQSGIREARAPWSFIESKPIMIKKTLCHRHNAITPAPPRAIEVIKQYLLQQRVAQQRNSLVINWCRQRTHSSFKRSCFGGCRSIQNWTAIALNIMSIEHPLEEKDTDYTSTLLLRLVQKPTWTHLTKARLNNRLKANGDC